MCWLWKSHTAEERLDYANELNLDEIRKIFEGFSLFKPIIYVSGGEPFVRKDLVEVIRCIKDHGLFCCLLTNGTLISKEVGREVVNCGLDSIWFSIEGDKDTHNRVRGEEAFEKAVNGMETIIRARASKTLPLVNICLTISKTNYDRLHEVIPLAAELKVDHLSFNHLQFISEKQANDHAVMMKQLFGIECEGIFRYVVSDNAIGAGILAREFQEIKSVKTSLDISFSPNLATEDKLRHYYNAPSFTLRRACTYPWFGAVIKPDGALVPCRDSYTPEYVIGNLRENKFDELWNSEKAKLFRVSLKKHKLFPGCSRCCALR